MTIAIASAMIIAITIWWLRRRWIVVTVEGESMAPTLRDGQQILARRVGTRAELQRGDVVVFRLSSAQAHASERLVHRVKRIAALAGDPVPAWMGAQGRVPRGCVVVAGDNARSQDSRQLGYIDGSAIIAVVQELR